MTSWTDDEVGGTVWSDDESGSADGSLTGADVDVDADKVRVIDATDNRPKLITVEELVAKTAVFAPSGTGAIAQTVEEELRRIIRPQHFGAAGDGVTDDVSAWQKAINRAEAIGGTVVGGGFHYKVSGAIKITTGGIAVDLTGTRITSTGTFTGGDADDSAVINIRGSAAQCENVRVDGGVIDGPASAGEAWGVHVSWAKDVWICGVKVTGAANAGIRVDGYGETWADSAHVGTLDEGYTSYVSVTDCVTEDNDGAGIEVIADATHCTITGNRVSGNAVNGLRVAYASFSTVTNNIIQDTGKNSKSLYVTGRSLIVTDNFISGKNSAASGASVVMGIYLTGDIQDSLIADNIIQDVDGEGIYGIAVVDGTDTITRTTVARNKVLRYGKSGNSTWGIVLRGAGYDSNIIEDNEVYTTIAGARGVNLQAGSGRAPIFCVVRRNIITCPSTLLTVSGRANKSYANTTLLNTVSSQRTIDGDAFGPDDYVATGVPSTGTFEQRDRVWVDPPTSGAAMGHVCTVAGTQGTLSSVTGDITSGTAVLVVNDASSIELRDRITVAGVTGIFSAIAISGTTITLSANADATVSGAAVAYSNATFKAMANLA